MLDIFSHTSEKPEEKIEIVADHREKNSLVISELISRKVQVNFEHLEVADFLVKDTAIERKTVSDFLSSMMNRRLSEQLINLQQYESRLLIIEGIDEQELYNLKYDGEGMNPNAIRGFLLDIVLKYQVPIIFTKNYEDTAIFLVVLAKKEARENISLRAKRKSFDIEQQKQFILEGFPGIGPGIAKKLLKEYGSLKKIFSASQSELSHSLGKKSENFTKLLG